jgi:putative endonuclease
MKSPNARYSRKTGVIPVQPGSLPRRRESTLPAMDPRLRGGELAADYEEAPTHVIPAQAGIHYNDRTMRRQYCVYILANKPNGTLYTGVTNNIARRVWEHKQGLVEGFTKEYGVHRLVYCESFARPQEAIRREKRLKKWNRAWKIRLIESANPEWNDLYETVMYMP